MGEFDVCVVDCAPTGATLRMLNMKLHQEAEPSEPEATHIPNRSSL